MSKVVFVSDFFVDEIIGGAELTTQALVESCPFPHVRIKSKDVTIESLQKYQDHYWIFGNFSQLDYNLIPTMVGNIRYSVLEYDYKFCKYRSIERHLEEGKEECDCQ